MSLQDALRTLADAHGAKALAGAFALVQGHVRQARRVARQQYGQLAQTFVAAMQIWDQQKADGVPKAERIAGLEKTLRAAWPAGREWKYLCGDCFDLGAVIYECDGGQTCGRHKRHLPHTFVQPCWCEKGAKFRAKPKPGPDDFTAAGKSKPMSRVGR